MDGWTNRMDKWMDGQIEWTNRIDKWMDGHTEQTNGWMDKQNGQMDGWTRDESITFLKKTLTNIFSCGHISPRDGGTILALHNVLNGTFFG